MPWISLVNRFIFLKQTLTIAINFSSRTFTATLWTQSFFTTKTRITRLVEWLTKQKSNIVNKKVFFPVFFNYFMNYYLKPPYCILKNGAIF